jgi:hypothetical protein
MLSIAFWIVATTCSPRFDLEGLVKVRQRLVDLVERVAVRILEHKRPPQGQCLAVDRECVVPVRVVDPEVAAERHQLLIEDERLCLRVE